MPRLRAQTEHLRRELENIVNKLIDTGRATSERQAIIYIHKQITSGKRKLQIGYKISTETRLYTQYKEWKRSKARNNPAKHTI
jgi:hypothetical protein